MSPRPSIITDASPFKDMDGWIRESFTGNPLAWVFRTASKEVGLTDGYFSMLLEKFINDPIHGIDKTAKSKSTFKGNTEKNIRDPSPSWNKFLFLMKLIGFDDFRLRVTTKLENGRSIETNVFVPLKGVNVIGKDRVIDKRNFIDGTLKKETKKIKRDAVLTSDTRCIENAEDEMAFLIRSILAGANIDLLKWSELMNLYVKNMDKVKRCHTRNNFTTHVLLHNSATWKKFVNFLTFIRASAIKLEFDCKHSNGKDYKFAIVVPVRYNR